MWKCVDERDTQGLDLPGWPALMDDLAAIAADLTQRHRERHAGQPLTWRAILELERRVVEQLKRSRRHNPDLLYMIRTDDELFAYPCTDDPVDPTGHGMMPIVITELWLAWRRTH